MADYRDRTRPVAALPTSPLSDLREADAREVIERALEAAREALGMDMAYLADMRLGLQDYVAVTGDGESFGAHAGEAVSLRGTYCELLLEGSLDGVVADAREHPQTADLAITERGDIGAYVGVPVTLSDGRVYGTFCCLSHEPDPGLQERDQRLLTVLARLVGDQLEREDRLALERHAAVAAGTADALMAALAARDGYTEEHSHAVVDLGGAVAVQLGLDAAAVNDVQTVARLHDIGKIGVPDAVLRKPGKLSPEEWRAMQRHTEIGAEIVAAMPTLDHLAPAIRAEHERWDGGGYPDGLAREDIPVASRIVLVCDAYHAMTSDRPYRQAMPVASALDELRRNAGTQFCPATVAAAIGVLGG